MKPLLDSVQALETQMASRGYEKTGFTVDRAWPLPQRKDDPVDLERVEVTIRVQYARKKRTTESR